MMRKRGARASIVTGQVEKIVDAAAPAAQRLVASNGSVALEQPGAPFSLRYAHFSQRGYYPDAPDKTNQDAVRAAERLGGHAGARAGRPAVALLHGAVTLLEGHAPALWVLAGVHLAPLQLHQSHFALLLPGWLMNEPCRLPSPSHPAHRTQTCTCLACLTGTARRAPSARSLCKIR